MRIEFYDEDDDISINRDVIDGPDVTLLWDLVRHVSAKLDRAETNVDVLVKELTNLMEDNNALCDDVERLERWNLKLVEAVKGALHQPRAFGKEAEECNCPTCREFIEALTCDEPEKTVSVDKVDLII